MIVTRTVKNGPRYATYTWEIDESKPQVWIEGHDYKFNSTLIKVEHHDNETYVGGADELHSNEPAVQAGRSAQGS